MPKSSIMKKHVACVTKEHAYVVGSENFTSLDFELSKLKKSATFKNYVLGYHCLGHFVVSFPNKTLTTARTCP